MSEASEKRIGNLFGATGGNHAGMVYDKNGLSPTLNSMQGGYRQPMMVEVIRLDENNKDTNQASRSES